VPTEPATVIVNVGSALEPAVVWQ
jgi:hypothetical protein